MCGIWGFVGSDETVATNDAWRGLDALTARGPDDQGAFVAGEGRVREAAATDTDRTDVFLGNRRLSILDLSESGSQPMYDPEAGCWLVYNGEVYNYQGLRDELAAAGHEFESDSDTEVVLRAYVEYGQECVERFRGMYAFAIWDTEREELFAARDPLGIKPFYFSTEDNRFAFASEVTSLLEGDVVSRDLDEEAAEAFLAFGSVPEPLSIVDGVQKLPAGSTLTYDRSSGSVEIESFWSTESGTAYVTPDEVWDRFVEAVSLRLRSDVPVGAFLSGGLDSSAIVAAIREADVEEAADLRTFSIDFGEQSYSEGDAAERVAEDLGAQHTTRVVSAEDVAEELPNVFEAMDQPTVDGINTYFVSQAAADDLRVALSGVGGDELFFGYQSFSTVPRLARVGQLARVLPDVARSVLAEGLDATSIPGLDAPGHELADLVRADNPLAAAYVATRGLFPTHERTQLFGGERPGYDAIAAVGERAEDLPDVSRNAVSELELSWYMRNQLLADTDVMGMAHSLEIRVPFLDVALVNLVTNASEDAKTTGPNPKPLLNRASAGHVPDYVREREKTGFEFPFADWLRGELRDEVTSAFAPARLETLPLDPASVEEVWDEFQNGRRHWSRVWALVVLSKWVDTHLA